MMKDRKIGSYMTLVAGILAIAALVVYIFVMYKLPIVFVALILSGVAAACSFSGKVPVLTKIAPVLLAFLLATAIIWAVNPMVNQLGYVVSGLDDISTVMALLISGGIMVIAMILAIVSAFLRQNVLE